MMLTLALKSIKDRAGSVALSVLAMAVSIFVLLGVEHIRQQVKASFSSTVSGVDMIVGARTGATNLLLYSVFRVGTPTNNISWDAYQYVIDSPDVRWSIPLSLGDSHRGYRVLGTTDDYFRYFKYGQDLALRFETGRAFGQANEVVLGFEAAKKLGYQLGDSIVLSHGVVSTHFSQHDDYPFTVVGILLPTGTPVDQTVHISLEGIEAIHRGWKNGVKIPSRISQEQKAIEQPAQPPQSITAFLVGLESRMSTFRVQRAINNYRYEPLMAILPGVALTDLWQTMRVFENALRLVSILVFLAASLGLTALLLASIRERKQEMYLLRTIGVSPARLLALLQLESIVITAISCAVALLGLEVVLFVSQDYLLSRFGLAINVNILTQQTGLLLALLLITTALLSMIPSLKGYFQAKRFWG